MLSYALLALGAAELASAAGVTALLTPTASAPAGCSTDYPGVFQVTIATLDATVSKRAAMNETSNSNLNLTLSGGVLRDYPEMRYGYIASNYQFQFDANQPQAGALYTAGFAVCQNGTLALGDNLVFDECLSGSFYNLYLNNSAAQCTQILINALPVSSGTASAASSSVTAKVSQITDGQVQATTAITSVPATTSAPKVSQITDGQIQATTAISKVPATTTSVPRVSQISDGQIQATTAVTSAPALFTGAAVMPKVGGEFFAAAAGVAALALF